MAVWGERKISREESKDKHIHKYIVTRRLCVCTQHGCSRPFMGQWPNILFLVQPLPQTNIFTLYMALWSGLFKTPFADLLSWFLVLPPAASRLTRQQLTCWITYQDVWINPLKCCLTVLQKMTISIRLALCHNKNTIHTLCNIVSHHFECHRLASKSVSQRSQLTRQCHTLTQHTLHCWWLSRLPARHEEGYTVCAVQNFNYI